MCVWCQEGTAETPGIVTPTPEGLSEPGAVVCSPLQVGCVPGRWVGVSLWLGLHKDDALSCLVDITHILYSAQKTSPMCPQTTFPCCPPNTPPSAPLNSQFAALPDIRCLQALIWAKWASPQMAV